MNTLLKSATLLTMNPRREILEGYDLYVENDRIENIAPQGSLTCRNDDRVLDCKGKFVIPGLISAHSHLTGMFQRGLWDETTFEAWTSRSSATEGLVDLSAEEIFVIHCAACIELIRHGVTTALNMFTTMPYLSREKVESACQAFKDTGLRGILALSLKDQSPDNEGIDPGAVSHDTWIRFATEVSERIASLDGRLSLMLAPSAPQRCSDQLLRHCSDLSKKLKVGVHTHLAETKGHAEVGRRIYGEPIVHHLERIGFLAPDLSVAHSIWLEDQEFDLLKKYNVKIVHNPSSNMKLGSGIAQVKKMLSKGLTVSLGADSVNAGTVYSIFEQMKLSVLLPRAQWEPESWVLPEEAFEMATLGGARALLQDDIIGSIEAGKRADLVILSPSTSLTPMNDLVNQLVLCESGHSVETVFVNGAPVMLQGRIQSVDEGDILKKLSTLGPRIREAQRTVLKKG